MTDKINADTVCGFLADAVEEYGKNYRYRDTHTKCTYFEDDRPSCLVGYVLHRLGVQAQDIPNLNNKGVHDLLGSKSYPGPQFDREAVRVLAEAQKQNDTSGVTWGAAAERACQAAR